MHKSIRALLSLLIRPCTETVSTNAVNYPRLKAFQEYVNAEKNIRMNSQVNDFFTDKKAFETVKRFEKLAK